MKKKICPICASKNNTVFLKGENRTLRSCQNCGLVYVWPQPKEKDVVKLYQDEYYALGKKSEIVGYRDYEEQKRYLMPYFRKKLDEINKLRKGKKGKILDIGCAFGFFLEQAKNDGWQTVGLDISSQAVERVRRKSIKGIVGRLKKGNIKTDSFEVVTIFQTIEHDQDPLNLLSEIRRILNKNGLLVLTTPDQKGILPAILGKNWHGWRIKAHLYWFDQKSLRSALEKAGFKKISIGRDIVIWSSLKDVFEALEKRYSNYLIKFVYNLIRLLPKWIKEARIVPQIPLRELSALAEE
jgi:SAM-dependent methyltransferase